MWPPRQLWLCKHTFVLLADQRHAAMSCLYWGQFRLSPNPSVIPCGDNFFSILFVQREVLQRGIQDFVFHEERFLVLSFHFLSHLTDNGAFMKALNASTKWSMTQSAKTKRGCHIFKAVKSIRIIRFTW